jgi:hypothetical protein
MHRLSMQARHERHHRSQVPFSAITRLAPTTGMMSMVPSASVDSAPGRSARDSGRPSLCNAIATARPSPMTVVQAALMTDTDSLG